MGSTGADRGVIGVSFRLWKAHCEQPQLCRRNAGLGISHARAGAAGCLLALPPAASSGPTQLPTAAQIGRQGPEEKHRAACSHARGGQANCSQRGPLSTAIWSRSCWRCGCFPHALAAPHSPRQVKLQNIQPPGTGANAVPCHAFLDQQSCHLYYRASTKGADSQQALKDNARGLCLWKVAADLCWPAAGLHATGLM